MPPELSLFTTFLLCVLCARCVEIFALRREENPLGVYYPSRGISKWRIRAVEPGGAAMKNNPMIAFALAMSVLLISLPSFAHHSGSAFDLEHPVTLKGTVANFEWSNPHVFISLGVKDDKGNVEQWRVEANSPNMLTRVGWKREMIKEGDQLAVTGFLAKTGRKIMRLHSVTLANGQEFDGEGFK